MLSVDREYDRHRFVASTVLGSSRRLSVTIEIVCSNDGWMTPWEVEVIW